MVEQAIYTLLTSDADVAALVATRGGLRGHGFFYQLRSGDLQGLGHWVH
jgi:hypothetical protein